MSQPPKSTILAPAARCAALSGVCRSMASPGQQKKGDTVDSGLAPSVLLPERLRRRTKAAPDAPSVGRPNALGRPLSRLVAAPAQSWVPERLRELRLRRRVERQTFDVALSCTGGPRLPAVALLVKNRRRGLLRQREMSAGESLRHPARSRCGGAGALWRSRRKRVACARPLVG